MKLFAIIGLILISTFIIGCAPSLENKNQVEKTDETSWKVFTSEFDKEYFVYNEAFKKILFATGQEKNESIKLFEQYEIEWNKFYSKYKDLNPNDFSNDKLFQENIEEMNSIVLDSKELINNKEFIEAHESLEELRPLWQAIFERNEYKTRGYFMTEFHHVMEEVVIAAKNNDTELIKSHCPELSDLWDYTKTNTADINQDQLNQANQLFDKEDSNIQIICDAAERNNLTQIAQKGLNLKQGFIQTYIRYG